MTQQYVRRGDLAAADTDVVTLLMQQHGDIRNLFDEVEESDGAERADAFRRLVRLLAVHETAEQEIVHPYARRTIDGGEDVVADRLGEEREAERTLARLDEMGTDHPDFMTELTALRHEVMEHARAEERYEFTHLERVADPVQLARMARGVKAAEAMAPTRPHSEVQSPAAHAATGPITSLVDRVRDAIRKATDHES